jgi:hypothetical protein
VLGLTASNVLGTMPPPSEPLSGTGWYLNLFMQWHFRWLALAIYLMTAETICAGLVPQLSGKIAETFAGGGKEMGKITKGLDLHKDAFKELKKRERFKEVQREQQWKETGQYQ